MSNIHILLADDHSVMRTGLRLVLERQADFEVVGEASDGREAVALAAAASAGRGGDGHHHAQPQRHRSGPPDRRPPLPQIAIVMLSMHSDEAYVLRALKAGAAGTC